MARNRARKEREGIVRIEVSVRREDASLIRRIAAALHDPARQVSARALLQRGFGEPAVPGLKALLALAPLDGLDLDRDQDIGRDIDL